MGCGTEIEAYNDFIILFYLEIQFHSNLGLFKSSLPTVLYTFNLFSVIYLQIFKYHQEF